MHSVKSHRTFTIAFLLLFIFFHSGYAVIEYYCQMGMDIDASVCKACHPDHPPSGSNYSIKNASNTSCCETVLLKLDKVDTYTTTSNDVRIIVESTHTPTNAIVKDDNLPSFYLLTLFTEGLIPSYQLKGIYTSIHFSSYLR
jgi:hypothetical protein